MKCFNCGAVLKTTDYCSHCGADVKLYRRMLQLSNAYYNEGLAKAKVRDLTGAVMSLSEPEVQQEEHGCEKPSGTGIF